ncbi:MAG: hypothetical protein AAFX78_05675 [Cyanobacteria bacterium J06638_20]
MIRVWNLEFLETECLMRVRKVQEVDVPDLSNKLMAARKASSDSLLSICRQLEITPTYWYKLEKAENSTINYDLLRKIDELLSLNLDLSFSEDLDSINQKEKGMELSRLNWIKVITPPQDWPSYWAYNTNEINQMKEEGQEVINSNGVIIFPLGFKHEKAADPAEGDLILLTQHSKVTHIVEVLDKYPAQNGEWFGRFVKILWWKPELDWKNLPDRAEILGFNLSIYKGIPYEFDAFENFNAEWGGRREAFLKHLATELDKI